MLTIDTGLWDEEFENLLQAHGERSPFSDESAKWVDKLQLGVTKPSLVVHLAERVLQALELKDGQTAEQLHARLQSKRLSTVQELLHAFEQLGVVCKLTKGYGLALGPNPSPADLRPLACQVMHALARAQAPMTGSHLATMLPNVDNTQFSTRRQRLARCCQCLAALGLVRYRPDKGSRMWFFVE